MELKELVFELSGASGPSGFEDGAARSAAVLLRPFVDELWRDAMGNVIGVRHGAEPGGKKLLLDAHIDEVGLIITGHSEGFLRFSALGGLDPRVLPATEVKILTEPPIYGVISTMPPHVLSAEDMDKAAKIDELYIDAGLSDDEAGAVEPGTPAVFAVSPASLCGDAVSAKALDDRLCFAAILKALELLESEKPAVELYIMASVQEELGMRGAKTGAFSVEPDLCVAVDVTHASTPDSGKPGLMKLGGGVVIDVGPGMNRSVSNRLKTLAKENGVPYQVEVEPGNTGTNGWVIQTSRQGVATGLLSIPLRYMHSPVETARLCDAEAAAKLLALFVRSLDREGI